MTTPPEFVSFQPSEIFTFFFVMLGPLKILAPFAKLTEGKDASFRRELAVRAAGLATVALLVAAVVGTRILEKWEVSPGALAIAGGIVLLRVALSLVLEQYAPTPSSTGASPPAPRSAAMTLTFPTIVTPYGIAAVILLMSMLPGQVVEILGLIVAVMLLDLLCMLFARQILSVLGPPLALIGVILGVLQVALSVQMIIFGLHLVFAHFAAGKA
jgi:multiple antibiotic resistance protein